LYLIRFEVVLNKMQGNEFMVVHCNFSMMKLGRADLNL